MKVLMSASVKSLRWRRLPSPPATYFSAPEAT
jgi:hypothetical protein